MIDVTPLTDSTPLLGDGDALRARWEEDGVLYFRGVIDRDLMAWAEQHYRQALAAEELIDLSNDAPVWTGRKSDTWRPCDAIGTTVWHEVVKQPALNAIGLAADRGASLRLSRRASEGGRGHLLRPASGRVL
jgi:hypothetical protein